MSNRKPASKNRPVNPEQAARKARAKQTAQSAGDARMAAVYNVYHVCRLRMWEALAQLADHPSWCVGFATECEGSASARSENTSYWGGFKFQPERPPSGKVAGARNLHEYPEALRERTSGWREQLSPGAQAVADRAHGYLEYVLVTAVKDERVTWVTRPLLTALAGRPVFGHIWRGHAPNRNLVALPAVAAGNNADLTGRIYARMDLWRAELGKLDPYALPYGTTSKINVAAEHRPGDRPIHPLHCYLAARQVFWAEVARLETLYLGRFMSSRHGDGPLTARTQPDKHQDGFANRPSDRGTQLEDAVSREDFAQELCPYTYRAMESWHPARGCFSTYYEWKVRHALRNLRAQEIPRAASFAQEQDFMSGASDPYGSNRGTSRSWSRDPHTDAPAGVSDALVRGLTVQPDGPAYVALGELARDTGAKPLARRAAREALETLLPDQAPGTTTTQPIRRRRTVAA